jgi:hypothetical protein
MIYPFESMDRFFAPQFEPTLGREWHSERMREMVDILVRDTTLPLRLSYPFTLQRLYWLRANLDKYTFSNVERLRELIEFDIAFYENDRSQYFYGLDERRAKKNVLLQKLDTPDADGYIFPKKLFDWLPTHVQFVLGWPDYKHPELNVHLGVATNLVVRNDALYGTLRFHGYHHEEIFTDDNHFSYSIFGPTMFGPDKKTVEKYILNRVVATEKGSSEEVKKEIELYLDEEDCVRKIFLENTAKMLKGIRDV